MLISDTTRNPRPGEVEGKGQYYLDTSSLFLIALHQCDNLTLFADYHFVSQDDMKKLISDDAFIEHACFSGNMYGTR